MSSQSCDAGEAGTGINGVCEACAVGFFRLTSGDPTVYSQAFPAPDTPPAVEAVVHAPELADAPAQLALVPPAFTAQSAAEAAAVLTATQSEAPLAGPKSAVPVHAAHVASAVLVDGILRAAPFNLLPVQVAVDAATVPSQSIQKLPAVAVQHVAVSTLRSQAAPAQVPIGAVGCYIQSDNRGIVNRTIVCNIRSRRRSVAYSITVSVLLYQEQKKKEEKNNY